MADKKTAQEIAQEKAAAGEDLTHEDVRALEHPDETADTTTAKPSETKTDA